MSGELDAEAHSLTAAIAHPGPGLHNIGLRLM